MTDRDKAMDFAATLQAIASEWEPIEDMLDLSGRMNFVLRLGDALINGPVMCRELHHVNTVRLVIIALPEAPLPNDDAIEQLRGVPTGKGDDTASVMMHNGMHPEMLATLLGELAFAVSTTIKSGKQGHGQHGRA
jgi:hypothetical protein